MLDSMKRECENLMRRIRELENAGPDESEIEAIRN